MPTPQTNAPHGSATVDKLGAVYLAMLTLADIPHILIKKQLLVHLRHMLSLKLGNKLTPESAAKIRLKYADTSDIEFWTTPCSHDIFVDQLLLCGASSSSS